MTGIPSKGFRGQGSLFSKAYRPLAQQYFSAGPLPPPLLHPLLGGPLLCSLPGGSTCIFTSGGSHVTYPIMLLYTTTDCPSSSWAKFTWDHPLLCSFLGGGSTSVFTSRGSHVTYPIMFLYTAIEFPSASWAKFTWDPTPEFNRLTDRQTRLKTLPSRTLRMRAVITYWNRLWIVICIKVYVHKHFMNCSVHNTWKNRC